MPKNYKFQAKKEELSMPMMVGKKMMMTDKEPKKIKKGKKKVKKAKLI
jgi:hypothetical protein